jgi:hypothetical protein
MVVVAALDSALAARLGGGGRAFHVTLRAAPASGAFCQVSMIDDVTLHL